MAGPFDILGNAEEDRLLSLAEEDKHQFAERFRAQQSRKAFRAAEQENKRLLRAAERIGVEPPSEPSQGFLSRAFDILDTDGQLVRGAIAKASGLPEYADKSYLDAALQGDEQDLTVGDILRKKDILQGQDWPTSILRGLTSFVGDVATAPTSFISLGTTGIARAGGKALTKKAIQTAAGEITTAPKLYASLAEKIAAASGGKLDAAAIERLAGNPFRQVRSALDKERKITSLGVAGTEAERIGLANVRSQVTEALETLGLPKDFNAKDLFEQPAIRFSSLLPGVGNKWIKLPVLNSTQTLDIPGVTDLSAKVFDKLGGAFYRTNLKVGRFLDDSVKNLRDGGRFAKAAAEAIDFERKIVGGIGSAFSRKARYGSKMFIENMDELTAAKAAVRYDTMLQAEQLLSQTGVKPDDIAQGMDLIEQGIRRHVGKNGKIARKGGNLKFEQDVFQREMETAVSSLNAMEPGRGDRMRSFIDRVRSDFDKYAKIELEEGVLGSALDGYARHQIRVGNGMDLNREAENFVASAMKGGTGFTLERKYLTAAEAKARGLDINTNLLDSWMSRTVAHHHAMAEKRFLDRSVYEDALPRDVYNKLHGLLSSENEKEAGAAMAMLKAAGVPGDAALSKKIFEEAAGVRKNSKGIIITPDNYDYLKNAVQSGKVTPEIAQQVFAAREKLEQIKPQIRALRGARDSVKDVPGAVESVNKRTRALLSEARATRAVAEQLVDQPTLTAFEEATRLGLRFDDAEREAIVNGYGKYVAAQNRTLGRMGESFYDRSGASELPQRFHDFLAKHLTSLDPEEAASVKNFYQGVFPTSIVRGMNEMLDTRDTMQRLADWSKDSVVKQAAAAVAKASIGWTKLMKTWTTQIFPAFHAQNLGGSFLQAAHYIPLLGSAINPVRVIQNRRLLKGEGALVQDLTGRVFTGPQIDDLMRRFHVKTVFGDSIDIVHAQADALNSIVSYKEGLRPKGMADRLKSFSSAIENFGREHTFIELLRQGNAPEDAARIANQVLIDYARNKTPFERHIANHLIFFYTYPRQQTANTIHALFTKPGAITAQIHAVNGVKELLSNSEELNNIPDFDEKMMSLRAKETFGRVIGTDAQGMPEVLSDVGVPIKDLTRLMEVRFPEKLTVGALLDAGGESVERTAKLWASQTNPVLKTLVEIGSGKNMFFDRPLTDKSIRRLPILEEAAIKLIPYGYQRIPRALLGGLDSFVSGWMHPVDNGDGTVTVDPVKYSLLTNGIPALARGLNMVKASVKEGVPTSRKLARALLPGKISSLNFETSGTYDRNRQLEDFFETRGLPTSKAQVNFYKRNNPGTLDDEIESILEE